MTDAASDGYGHAMHQGPPDDDVPCERCGLDTADQRFDVHGVVVRACNACVEELTEYGWLNSWLTVRARRTEDTDQPA
ncbi:hypothetical protein DSM104329_04233 [Capillimicrobium parvum]|uniref:Uncharacterized protein n=2 Tax=Capillimicrobium parvum TaxID=2884022 RepID=A0A9E7C2N1_9ACTN|nr:hypothetical protein DSM104329_04233 [Capillimicrobium parvum]